jgi:lysophospholipase L1-like esterase
LVVCAGENDIGSGIAIAQSEGVFQKLLSMLKTTHLIFLGPKFEPWLAQDMNSRKHYVQMSQAFQRCSQESGASVTFVNCLTMFCGKTATLPGALFGGRAIPETQYFDDDQFHLSNAGYDAWQKVVEEKIVELLHCQTYNL